MNDDTMDVLLSVLEERNRQGELWGEQNHPDYYSEPLSPSISHYLDNANDWKETNKFRAELSASVGIPVERSIAWDGILLEEVYEALSETDPKKMRVELIQVAAVAVAWVECIDRRAAESEKD